jgi:hypothetical protein
MGGGKSSGEDLSGSPGVYLFRFFYYVYNP